MVSAVDAIIASWEFIAKRFSGLSEEPLSYHFGAVNCDDLVPLPLLTISSNVPLLSTLIPLLIPSTRLSTLDVDDHQEYEVLVRETAKVNEAVSPGPNSILF